MNSNEKIVEKFFSKAHLLAKIAKPNHFNQFHGIAEDHINGTIITTSSTSSNTTTQAAENKIIELQEKLNEQYPLNNSNIVLLALQSIQDNLDRFSISKILLAKTFRLDNKAI
ncbi:43692_t:CDS:2 [Gigaspora margarita]|uniref:43692_t:CDS:1 n=1 Tax=Gigaspora margarita TaxID=4874 RepID=A0ABM8VY23_GIGMA|nr:43692_t:CDS:2 [Gigaspora margarita]